MAQKHLLTASFLSSSNIATISFESEIKNQLKIDQTFEYKNKNELIHIQISQVLYSLLVANGIKAPRFRL